MNIKANIRQMTIIFIVLFLALSVGLVYWQVVAAEPVSANVHNSRAILPGNTAIRGNIFDRNGVLLAYSKPDPNVVGGYIRTYTDPSLAGLIGYYVPDYPSTGIEKQFDDVLSGRVGATELGNTVNSILHRPPVGDDIYLTIDERIQQIANSHFDDPTSTVTNRSNRGSVIISNPHTGEVLAMVSRPSFDPNQIVQTLQQNDLSYYNQLTSTTLTDADAQYGSPPNPLLERPLQGLYDPGSTYKTVTLMAGLDSGKTTLNEEFDKQHALGPITVNGQPIGPTGNNLEPYTTKFPVTTEYGYTHSDNIIFAQIGLHTGFDTWMDYNKRFYVEQQVPFDLPVAVSHVLPPGQDTMNENQLAAGAFGQGTDLITPFQMSLFDNAAANDGQLMHPRLVSQIADHQTITDTQKSYQGNPIQTFNPQVLATPINQQTAVEVRQAMYGVIRCGSGLLVPPLTGSKASVIGKTGTAELGNGLAPHGWMITAAPYTVDAPGTLPALTIVGMKENDGHGSDSVGPMIAHMYEDIFSQIPQFSQVQLPRIPSEQEYCGKTQLLQI